MKKKLYKTRDGKVDGVCQGFANYLDFDVTIIRIIWALVALTGSGVVFYIVCAMIMAREPLIQEVNTQYNN